jgi:hypothetical protein
MLSIEKALGIYTDMLNANEKIDLNYFKKQLSHADYTEFLELIEFVKLGKSVKATSDFDKKFDELDKYKDKHYSNELPRVSGFRGEKDACDKDAIDKLDEIFKEEFGDEE